MITGYKFLTAFLVALLVFSFVTLAANEASVSYSLDDQGTGITKIVQGVPFHVKVSMALTQSTGTPSITYLELYTKATSSDAVFTFSGEYGWLRSGPATSNCIVPSYIVDGGSGSTWIYKISPACAVSDSNPNGVAKSVERLTLSGKSIGEVTLDSSQSNTLGNNNKDASGSTIVYTAKLGSAFAYDPQPTSCGDGVVDTSAGEACDDNNAVEGDGCAKTCKYVELGYSCIRTSNGDRKSVCTSMPKGQLFVEKMTALFQTKLCYPNKNHPARIYDWYCDSDNTNDVPSKAQIIAAVAEALRIYFKS